MQQAEFLDTLIQVTQRQVSLRTGSSFASCIEAFLHRRATWLNNTNLSIELVQAQTPLKVGAKGGLAKLPFHALPEERAREDIEPERWWMLLAVKRTYASKTVLSFSEKSKNYCIALPFLACQRSTWSKSQTLEVRSMNCVPLHSSLRLEP